MTSPISFTVRPPSAPHRPSPLGNGAIRAGAPSRRLFEQGAEDEEEDERGSGSRSRVERVDGFRNGRAHGGEKPPEPLVIPAIPNRDWRQSSTRRTPSFRPENPNRNEVIETYERNGDEPQKSGLRYAVNTDVDMEGETIKVERVEEVVVSNGIAPSSITTVKAEPLTLEEQALQAILAGDVARESEDEKAQRELVIAMGSGATTPMTEDDAFKRDVATLPEESTLDDYDAVPVSAFGMAMARGMGWNPSSQENTTVHEPKLRPQLLGLGATPMDVTIRPTHNRGDSKKKKPEHSTRSGRGFVPTNLLVKKEINGESSESVTPAGSGSADESDGSRRRRREDDYDSERESKRREEDRDRARDRNGESNRGRYETEEERARRKARERDKESRRDGDRYTNGNGNRHTNGNGNRHTNGDREKYGEDRRDRDSDRESRRDRDRHTNGDGDRHRNGDKGKHREERDPDKESRRDRDSERGRR